MDYVKPFTYFAGATGGFVNLLFCAVCNLIPVLGPIVLLGYRAEVAEELVRDRRLRRHPEFDFGRFGDYLSRGVWPFVYQLGFGLLLGVVLLAGIAVAALFGPLGLLAGVLVLVPVVLGAPVFLWPMELHAQLSGRFAPVEAFGFASRFAGRMWGLTLVSLITFLAGSVVVGVLGLLACGVGLYLSAVVQLMAQQHLMTQLYRLYLADGGDLIDGPDDDDEYDD